jgi:hypothetical protein
MSILNLGLQGVSTARSRGSDGTEAALKSCNSMSEIRKEADRNPQLQSGVAHSLGNAPVIALVEDQFMKLSLKEKGFEIGAKATDDDIECLWSFTDNTTKKDIMKAKTFLKFIEIFRMALCHSHAQPDMLRLHSLGVSNFHPP